MLQDNKKLVELFLKKKHLMSGSRTLENLVKFALKAGCFPVRGSTALQLPVTVQQWTPLLESTLDAVALRAH